MKTRLGSSFGFILLCAISYAQQSSAQFPKLTGPYLGQKPPGMTPEIFAPGIVARDGIQGKLNISPDQREVIYFERAADGKSMYFIRLTRTGDQWNPPEIMPFSKEYINQEPVLSPDGRKLFFVSDRPLSKGAGAQKTPDIWYVEKTGDAWGEPVNLGPPVNDEGIEVQPFMSADGHFFFCRPPAEMYCSNIVAGKLQTPVKLSKAINIGWVSSPCLPPDCSYMIFHSKLAGGKGSFDLYVSFKDESENWTEAKNITVLNTPGAEGGPTISPDGKYLFFTRDGKIHWVSTKIVEALRLPETAP